MAVAVAKVEKLKKIKATLAEHKNFVITAYRGLGVPAQNDLRNRIREQKGVYKVVKNNLLLLALKENTEYGEAMLESIAKDLEGPVGIAFMGEEFPAVSKALLAYKKDTPAFVIKSGCMDSHYIDLNEIKVLANLPSRDELLSVIARGLNAPATKIARGLHEVMGALGRGIKAVGEKNG